MTWSAIKNGSETIASYIGLKYVPLRFYVIFLKILSLAYDNKFIPLKKEISREEKTPEKYRMYTVFVLNVKYNQRSSKMYKSFGNFFFLGAPTAHLMSADWAFFPT